MLASPTRTGAPSPIRRLGENHVAAGYATVTGTGVDGGTISAASVGTVRLDPGRWENGAGNWSTCFTRVLKKNGVVVSGAFASGWTYNMAGQVSNGDVITIEVAMTNSFGSSTKTITYTVGA